MAPAKTKRPRGHTVEPWLLSRKHTHRFSYELLGRKDTLMLIAYIIPSTSI